jgi:hypothetical protein
MGCLLAVLWVQQVGQRARVQLEGELRALAAGELPAVEPLAAELEALPLVTGADGVMVPFRPYPDHDKDSQNKHTDLAHPCRVY